MRTDLLMKDLNRAAIGMTAACILIVAASTSALPGVSCTAMAETYGRAITYFGFTALYTASSAVFLGRERLKPLNFLWTATYIILFLAGFVLFSTAILATNYNLKMATKHCYIGTPDQLKFKAHERIPLAAQWDVSMWRSLPSWEN